MPGMTVHAVTSALACALLVGLCFGEPLDATVNRVAETQQEPGETPDIEALRRAADQGDADAQYNLGVMYSNGEGVPQDFTQAMAWYRQAADQGDAGAQYNLGVMYANGEGVPEDDAQAVAWYRQAADQSYAPAQASLGKDGPGAPL